MKKKNFKIKIGEYVCSSHHQRFGKAIYLIISEDRGRFWGHLIILSSDYKGDKQINIERIKRWPEGALGFVNKDVTKPTEKQIREASKIWNKIKLQIVAESL